MNMEDKMKYELTITFDSDNKEVAKDLFDIVERIAPYMVDNLDAQWTLWPHEEML